MVWWLALGFAQDIAVPDMNVQYFRPSIDAQGTLWTDDVRGGDDGSITPRVLLHYTDAPLRYRYASGATVPVMSGMAMGDLLLGYRKGPLRFGLDVPLVLSAEGVAASGEFGLGDVGLDVMAAFDNKGFGWGVSGRYALPTATTLNPLGNPRGDAELMALAHIDILGDWLAIVANGGVGGHPGVELEGLGNWQLRGRSALTVKASDGAGGAFEFVARSPLSGGDSLTLAGSGELLVSGWAKSGPTTLRGGIGTGVSGGIGASDLRAMLGVEWGKPPPPPDTDGDGIIDDLDLCRLEPEDYDGVLDGDGCVDVTPTVLIDVVTGAGTALEGRVRVTRDGQDMGTRNAGARWQLDPGTYEVAVDGEGYDAVTQEITVSSDGTQAMRIEILRPGKVTVTAVDAAGKPVEEARYSFRRAKLGQGPSWTGTLPEGEQTVIVRAPGYKATPLSILVTGEVPMSVSVTLDPARATLEGDRIVIRDRVYFDTGSAVIQKQSYSLLDEVASILADRPEVLLLRIEGHSDATGDAAANLKLSDQRANAVMDYLIGRGVDFDRLDAAGFGQTKPLVKGTSDEANAQNRRVEFVVAKKAPAP